MEVAMADTQTSRSLPEQVRALTEIVAEQARAIGLLNTRLTVLEHARETDITAADMGYMAGMSVIPVEGLSEPYLVQIPKAKRGRARKEVADGK